MAATDAQHGGDTSPTTQAAIAARNAAMDAQAAAMVTAEADLATAKDDYHTAQETADADLHTVLKAQAGI
jgi:hypothetical protein